MPIKFKVKGKLTTSAILPEKVKVAPPEPPPPQPTLKVVDFPQNYLKFYLHEAMAKPSKPRPHNVVHASDLDPERGWCPREPALLTLHNMKRPEGFLSTAMSTTFQLGHAGADIIIRNLPPDRVWGSWKCRACGLEVTRCYTPSSCTGCGASRKLLRYVEVFMRDPETEVVGSCDLWFDMLDNGVLTPIEIKTEGNASFKKRSKPEFGHEWRLRLYMALADKTPWLKGLTLSNSGRVVYMTKEGHAQDSQLVEWKAKDWKKSPFKEYMVNRDDSFSVNALDAVMTYRVWRRKFDAGVPKTNNPLPARRCKSSTDTRAGNCAVCAKCFT